MKKKKFLVVVTLFFGLLNTLSFAINVKSWSYYRYYFDTDAETYFTDGKIEINATWDMYHDTSEEMYFQVQIYNSSDISIWNSSKYEESGSYDETWIVDISNLSLSNDYSNNLSVRFFLHCYHKVTYLTIDTFINEKDIIVYKKLIGTQLYGFTENLTDTDNLDFKIRFYDQNNSNNLVGQEVFFEILSEDILMHEEIFITNVSGMIDINFDASTYLNPGENKLVFSIEDNSVYNNTLFEYKVYVESNAPIDDDNDKITVGVQLYGFKQNLTDNEKLNFTMRFFNQNNNSNLINQKVNFTIDSNNTMLYQALLTTNSSGMIDINLNTSHYMNLGENKLIFSIEDNSVYNNTLFEYKVYVESNAPIDDDNDKITVGVQLYGFKQNLTDNEKLNFTMRFFNQNNNSNLINQKVNFTIDSNNTMLYQALLTTNSSGMIDINLNTSNYMNLGENILVFSLIGEDFYNNSVFEYIIFIENSNSLDMDEPPIGDGNSDGLIQVAVPSIFIGIACIVMGVVINQRRSRKHSALGDLTFRH